MSELQYLRRKAFLEAATLCSEYGDNLAEDHPDWRAVALECAHMLEEEAEHESGQMGKEVLTYVSDGSGACQEEKGHAQK